MTEADGIQLLKTVLSTSGGATLVWFAVQHFAKDWASKRERLINLEKSVSEAMVRRLEEAQIEIKNENKRLTNEVAQMREFVLKHQAAMTETSAQLSNQSTTMEKTLKAFAGYAVQSNGRMSKLETEIIQLAENTRLVRDKK